MNGSKAVRSLVGPLARVRPTSSRVREVLIVCPKVYAALQHRNAFHSSMFHRPTLRRPRKSSPLISGRHAFTEADAKLQRTPLYDLHIAHAGKMVPFAGYAMPVQYDDLSVGDSHRWTREKASLFDVGHMVQHRLSGPGVAGILTRLTPASVASLEPHHSTLSCLLHPGTGGIVDDTIITRLGPELFYVVTNAACREKDTDYLSEHIKQYTAEGGGAVDWEVLNGWGLLALQGPLSADILGSILLHPDEANLKDLYFGQSKFIQLRLIHGQPSTPLLISRGGYTGEDGFEISIPPDLAVSVATSLLHSAGPEKLRLAGLGARDSLRLEAGMCLYGHDLDDTTTPIEAGLSWTVAKDRRTNGGFHGDGVILRQLRPIKDGGSGVTRRRVGLIVEGAPAREGAEIVDPNGEVIGKITSGCPSPTLKQNIAMGYIKNGHHKSGTQIGVTVRGKRRNATVSKMPFVPSKYWKSAAPI
ncbi:MAG: Aminomethyltransferase, mitochondrial [Pycnora praestabilis]|nr:MAG: Aminomethyltransferase, mitochondrial [Pycnora praestabilis]